MIGEARVLAGELPVEFVVAAYDENRLPAHSFDAVTAIGLIEYLADDGPLFAEARRLLKDGGRFAVSCRNRLYNVVSANAYTARELERGEAAELLAELRERLAATSAEELREFAAAVALAGGDLAEAAELDASEETPNLLDHPTEFAEERRQHTPSELEASAAEHGFSPAGLYAVHPHPLPPGLEPLAPRTYNRLALAWQRPLEDSPAGLALCSAFVAVFEC
jgi:SAM-dependent methyltransferase